MVTNEKKLWKRLGKNLMDLAFFILDVLLHTYFHSLQKPATELGELVPLPYSQGRSIPYSDRLHDFLSPCLDVIRMSMSTVFFVAQLGPGILCL